MKNISRLTVIAFIAISLSAVTLESCPGLSLGARGDYMFPTGKESEFTKSAYGFDIYGAYRLFKRYQVGLILKYTMYNPLNMPMTYTESITSTDFYAFLDYYFWGDDYDDDCGFSPYAGLQLGKSFYMYSMDYNGQTIKSDRNTFVWDLHAGTTYKISKNLKLDLKLDYMNYNYSQAETFFNLGLGIKYSF